MVKNVDPVGDEILRTEALKLLDGLRAAVARNSPYPWREYPSNRFVSLYVRVTFRSLKTPRMKHAHRVPTVELASINVNEPYRGRGIYRAVIAEMKLIAKESGRVFYLENVLNPLVDIKLRKDPDFQRLRQVDTVSGDCYACFPK